MRLDWKVESVGKMKGKKAQLRGSEGETGGGGIDGEMKRAKKTQGSESTIFEMTGWRQLFSQTFEACDAFKTKTAISNTPSYLDRFLPKYVSLM